MSALKVLRRHDTTFLHLWQLFAMFSRRSAFCGREHCNCQQPRLGLVTPRSSTETMLLEDISATTSPTATHGVCLQILFPGKLGKPDLSAKSLRHFMRTFDFKRCEGLFCFTHHIQRASKRSKAQQSPLCKCREDGAGHSETEKLFCFKPATENLL